MNEGAITAGGEGITPKLLERPAQDLPQGFLVTGMAKTRVPRRTLACSVPPGGQGGGCGER